MDHSSRARRESGRSLAALGSGETGLDELRDVGREVRRRRVDLLEHRFRHEPPHGSHTGLLRRATLEGPLDATRIRN